MAVEGDITLFTNVKVSNVDTSAIKQSLASMTPKEIEEAFRKVNKTVMSMYTQLGDTARAAAKNSSDALVTELKSQQGVVSRYADQIKYAFIEMQSLRGRGKPLGGTVDTLRDRLAEYPALISKLQTNLDAVKQSANMKTVVPIGDVGTVEALITSYQRLNGVATSAFNSINSAFMQAKKNMDTEAQDMLKEPRNQISEYVDNLRYAFLNWNMAGSPAEGQLRDNLIAMMNKAKDVAPLTSMFGGDNAQLATASAETATLVSETGQLATAYSEVSGEAKKATSSIGNIGTKTSALGKTTSEATQALTELGNTASDAGEKGKQGADKAKTAHQNFQGTLTAVKYAMSAIGISSSSILGKLVILVGLLEDAFRGAGSAAQSIIPILGIFLSIGMSVFGTLIKWARKLVQVLVSIGKKLIEIGGKAVSVAKGVVDKIKDKVTGLIDFFKPSIKKLKKLLMQFGFGVRSPYFLIRKLRTEVIEGMKEIALQSQPVADMMNNFKKSLNSVKGTLVSAFEPIASYVIPILTRLLNMLAGVLDALAQFNARLLGRETYYKFAAADVNEYSNSVDGASKATKKLQHDLMGFDEINRLSDPNQGAGAGAGSSSTGSFIETAIDENSAISKWAERIKKAWKDADFTEIGTYVGNKLKSVLKNFNDTEISLDKGLQIGVGSGVQDRLRETAQKLAKSFATFLNGFVETPELGNELGLAIANMFNRAYDFLNTLVHTVHWASIGKFIGDCIATALENFDWYSMFDTIVTFINGLADLIYNAVVGHDWFAIGAKIGNSIVEAIKNFDAVKAGKAIHEFFMAIFNFINGFFDEMSKKTLVSTPDNSADGFMYQYMTGWELLAKKIRDFFFGLDTESLGNAAGESVSGAFFGFFEVLTGADFGEATKSFIDGFMDSINKYPWQSSMHDFWDVYYPKLKAFIRWAGPQLIELLSIIWDAIKGPILDIAIEIGKSIGGAIWDGIKEKLGFGLGDKPMTSYIEENATPTQGITGSGTGGSNLLKKLGKDSDASTKTVIDNNQKMSGSYNTAAESAKQAGEAQNASMKIVADTTKQSASAVDTASAKMKLSYSTSADSAKRAGDASAKASADTANGVTNASNVVVTQMGVTHTAITDTFSDASVVASDAWSNMQTEFDGAPAYFRDTFGEAWNEVQKTFKVGGELQQGLALGVGMTVTSSVNKMVDAINNVAIVPLMKLGNAVDVLRNMDFGGIKPFAMLPHFAFAKIPKLARGAVLPPNQPFLSIVGDQPSGTNVEAPLDTIKQAVAEVMNEQLEGMMAGFEAVVQAINNKDTTAVISYRAVGEANRKYNREMETIRGY